MPFIGGTIPASTASDPLLAYLQQGHPRVAENAAGFNTTLVYRGRTSVLQGAKPAIAATWGTYDGVVEDSELQPLYTDADAARCVAELTVVLAQKFEPTGSLIGTVTETSYEVDWISVSRSIYDHPAFQSTARGFAADGAYALTPENVAAIRAWEKETDELARSTWAYFQRDNTGAPTGAELGLLTNEKIAANLILTGVESFDDVAPVVRKTRTYVGGPPDASTSGLKSTPTGFPNLPSGYEWKKSADRHLRQGAEVRWTRFEEWEGAKKVLLDRTTIYLLPP